MQLKDYSKEELQAELDSRKPTHGEPVWQAKGLQAKLDQLKRHGIWWV